MCLALSKGFSTLCAIRFLVGLAESSFYPGIQVSPNLQILFLDAVVVTFYRPAQYVIGSWYNKEELAKRSCLFHVNP